MNPFQMVMTELWQLPQQHPTFRQLVRVGNRIRYDGTDYGDPHKKEIQSADTPEVVLTSETASVKMHATSSTSSVTRQYSWLIASGDFRINEVLLQVEWALFVGMLKWKEIISPLEYRGQRFAKRMDVVSVVGGQSDAQRNRGIKGWSAIWRCEVEMHFKTAELLEELSSWSSSSSSGS